MTKDKAHKRQQYKNKCINFNYNVEKKIGGGEKYPKKVPKRAACRLMSFDCVFASSIFGLKPF